MIQPPLLDDFLAEAKAEVTARLAAWLPAPPGCPPCVAQAMRYAVGSGGKRLRPLLTLAAADAVVTALGGDERDRAVARTQALPAACAIEMVHTLSLVHDDLPAMDDDTMRRGQPAVHVRFGEGLAILAGDGLLSEAFGLLAREPRAPHDAALALRKLRTIERVAEAIGASGMAGGQAIDLALAGTCSAGAPTLDLDGLTDMHRRKTGALMRVAGAAGVIMAGGSPAQEAAVAEFAERLGLAYQIVDDLLDDDRAGTGKTAGKDVRAAKPTFPALVGRERSRRVAGETIDHAIAVLDRAHLAHGPLVAIAGEVAARLAPVAR